MRKQLLIASALLVSAVTFAQKDELKSAAKALKSGNAAEAKTTLDALSSSISSADDKYKGEYYYLRGQAYYDLAQKGGANATQDYMTSVEAFNSLIDFESSTKKKYTDEVKQTLQTISGNLVNAAIEDNKSEDYKAAADKLYSAYLIDKANQDYLYFAASSAVNGGDYVTALKYYNELKDLGYTGVSTKYYAVNIASGEKEDMGTKQNRDLMVKAKTHKDPTEEESESRLPEIVKNIALIYSQQGNNEMAVKAIKDARAANPDDIGLLMEEANLYVKLDDKVKFQELMQEAIQKDPNNATLYYNLGVITAEQGDKAKAKEYYAKAIELDPTSENSYLNMASLVLSGEKDIVDEMNGLGNTKADNIKYEELKKQREDVFKEAVPYLEKILDINPKNVEATRTLMNIYGNIGENDKYKMMKEKLSTIE